MNSTNQCPSPQVETADGGNFQPVAYAQQIADGLAVLSCDEATIILDLTACLLRHRRLVERDAGLATLQRQWDIQDGRTPPERAEQVDLATPPSV